MEVATLIVKVVPRPREARLRRWVGALYRPRWRLDGRVEGGGEHGLLVVYSAVPLSVVSRRPREVAAADVRLAKVSIDEVRVPYEVCPLQLCLHEGRSDEDRVLELGALQLSLLELGVHADRLDEVRPIAVGLLKRGLGKVRLDDEPGNRNFVYSRMSSGPL